MQTTFSCHSLMASTHWNQRKKCLTAVASSLSDMSSMNTGFSMGSEGRASLVPIRSNTAPCTSRKRKLSVKRQCSHRSCCSVWGPPFVSHCLVWATNSRNVSTGMRSPVYQLAFLTMTITVPKSPPATLHSGAVIAEVDTIFLEKHWL